MRLKSLILQGFKSFAERSVLEFEPGLTGIVGPNGCGKSNVVDAIRWVMGEQSPRSLRGSEMLDVVFAGTQRRESASFSKVQMTLEREDQEIEITRKLTRSGDSEYYLNRARCRLRDITELLMQNRLSLRDYAVIEQGKIDRILSMKPQERLVIFEEAAGVRHFNLQKEKTESKLLQTKENLERVLDIYNEVQRQCARLARQAAAARRWLELADQLELGRTRLFNLRFGRLERLEFEARAELEAFENNEREISSRLASLQAELADAEERLKLQQRSRSRLEADLRAVETALEATRAEHHTLAESEPQALRQREDAQQAMEKLRQRAAELGEELAAVAREEAELAEKLDLSSQDLRQAQEELERRHGRVREMEAKMHASRQEFVALHSRQATATGDHRRTEETLGREEHVLQRLTKTAEELRLEEAKLETARAAQEERREELAGRMASMEDRRAELEERRSVVLSRLKSRRDTLHELEKKIEAVSARHRTLEELMQALEGVSDGPRAVLQWAKSRGEHISLLLQSLDLPPEVEPLMTAALGDKLEAVISPSLRWTLEAIDALKDKLGPTTFIVRDMLPNQIPQAAAGSLQQKVRWLPGADPRLNQLISRNRVVASRKEAMELLATLPANLSLVTPQGETFDPAGFVSAGQQKSRAGLTLQRAQEQRRLRSELAGMEAERRGLEEEILAIDQEAGYLILQLEELAAQRKTAENERQQLGLELERSTLQLQRLRLDRYGIDQQMVHLNQQLESLRRSLQEQIRKVQELDAKIREAEALEQSQQAELASAREEFRLFEERELTSRRLEARSLGERLRALQIRAMELQKRRTEALEEAELREQDMHDSGRRLEDIRLRLGGLRQKEADLAERKVAALERLEQAQAGVQATSQALAERRESLEELHRRREQHLESGSALQVRLSENRALRSRVESLRTSLPAELKTELLEWAALDAEAVIEARIEDLEQKQKGLGNLNFAALEEYETVKERLDFLTAQKDDLERSVLDLQQAIEQLAERSATQFQDAFEKIRANFQELFQQVLAGEADLVLIQSGEHMGVEIRAQPPGKKVRSLELLSGGEKALVTILLLVAIFLFRPSSFCILDEVDAPLDDMNNRRFAELIGTIARTTQVLVVTHSKRTIEACDTLYGVTMDEPGVSKLVSVRLQGKAAS